MDSERIVFGRRMFGIHGGLRVTKKTSGRLGENDALEITLDGKHVTTVQRGTDGRFHLEFHGDDSFRVKRRKRPTPPRKAKSVTKRTDSAQRHS